MKMEYAVSVIKNVLGALYQTGGASLIIAALFMSVYMRIKKKGTGAVIQAWISEFRSSSQFRREFLLVFYVCMMLFRTLLCRPIWGNPLDSVMGIWGIHKPDGTIYTENIENLILFIPFMILLYWAEEKKTDRRKMPVQSVLLKSLWLSFIVSLFIEGCQLFLKIGTFQLTDLVFNSVGGFLGGLIYWGFDRSRKYISENVKKIGGWDVEPWKAPETETAESISSVSGTAAEISEEQPKEEKSSVDYESIELLVRQAGQKLYQARPTRENIHKKEGLANFCTDFDTAIQKFLIEELEKLLPGAAFFGEEDTEGNQGAKACGEYTFYIDPIDGTTNFMFGYHHSCVSVGLAHQGRMIAGFVYNPYVDEMYKGIRGQGSWLNGQKLEMENISVGEGIVAFGCARYNEDGADSFFRAVKELYMKSLSIRNGGSAALDLCRTASGSNAVYLEMKLQPYDFAAASLIVAEAGGVISQFDGAAVTLDGPCSVVAGAAKACEETREIIKSCR